MFVNNSVELIAMVSLSDFKKTTKKYLTRIKKTQKPILLLDNGKPAATIYPINDSGQNGLEKKKRLQAMEEFELEMSKRPNPLRNQKIKHKNLDEFTY